MTQNSPAYKIGDSETRPWGSYEVTGYGALNEGAEFCEKRITVLPGQVLSLQSHELRRELWRVEDGVLTVVLDDTSHTLAAGQSIAIPQGALHAMANLTGEACVVFERQEGICREADIRRFHDAYGRSVDTLPPGAQAARSLDLYKKILAER